MTAETTVTMRLDSASVFDALRAQVGEWRLTEHEFDPKSDEVRVVCDVEGSGRVAITVSFPLDQDGMARLLQAAHPPMG